MLSDEKRQPSAGGLTESFWTLRPVATDDADGLYKVASKPDVYRYLFDGSAPERSYIEQMVEQCRTDMRASGVGLWVLQNQPVRLRCAGAVWIKPDVASRSAELSYLLDPENWGQGLALRMAWTAVKRAFLVPAIDRIVAGVDGPNGRSFAVMKRLGMQFQADVTYPLGPGREYVLCRDDPDPLPSPELLPICD